MLTPMILLVHPPVAKPAEPPAGIARLSGALARHSIQHRLLDLNYEGIAFLLDQPLSRSDTWSLRAHRHRANHAASLRTSGLYGSLPRYQRAVRDLNRTLGNASAAGEAVVSLANVQHASLSPLRSADLLRSAEQPERDPFFPFFSRRLTAVMEEARPSRIGISLNFLSQALTAFAVIGFIHERWPGMPVVLGGGLVTSWIRAKGGRPLFPGLVDTMIDGPGELALLRLCGVSEPSAEPVMPVYDGLPLGSYLSPGLVLPYSASSGCWWSRCVFCPERAEQNPFAPLPPDRVCGDLASLSRRLRPALIHLLDNALTPGQLRAFIDRPPGAPWYGFARVTRELTDPAFCRGLRASGCVMLKLGLESGDQGVLDAMQKGMDLSDASLALRTLSDAGIGTYVYLIFGTPAEDRDAARRTLAFAAAHAGCIDYLNLAVFNMPVSGDEAARFATEPFYEGDLSLYTDFRHPLGWDRKLVRKFIDTEFVRHPAIAPIVRREPPSFGSNHAPFFVMASSRAPVPETFLNNA